MKVSLPLRHPKPVLDSWLETPEGAGWVRGYLCTANGWDVELEVPA